MASKQPCCIFLMYFQRRCWGKENEKEGAALVRVICTVINPNRHRCLGLFSGFCQIFFIIIRYFLFCYSWIGWSRLQDEMLWRDLEIEAASEPGGDTSEMVQERDGLLIRLMRNSYWRRLFNREKKKKKSILSLKRQNWQQQKMNILFFLTSGWLVGNHYYRYFRNNHWRLFSNVAS